MSRHTVSIRITCDGLKTCKRTASGIPVESTLGAARRFGWLIHDRLDLCPDCRKLPEFAELDEAALDEPVNLLDELDRAEEVRRDAS